MRSQRNSRQRRHYFQLHFGVAMDVLLIGCGLFLLALLLCILPTTSRGLTGFSYQGIAILLWNTVSLGAVAAVLWTVVFLPPNQLNRRWTQTWLILLLISQAVLLLLPDREAVTTLVRFLGPGWIAIALFIGLLHIESRTAQNAGLASADSSPKRPLKEVLTQGLKKLFAGAGLLFALALLVASGFFLTGNVRRQMNIRSWPVAQAELIRCETADGSQAVWNSAFELEYTFEVQGSSYSGGDFEMITDKQTPISFNAARNAVDQINSAEALQVAYNPANPSQNLIYPAFGQGFVMLVVFTVIRSLFYFVVSRYLWTWLAVSRLTDPESVYRVLPSRYEGLYLTITILYMGMFGFCLVAPLVPISTELFGALVLWLAFAHSYSLFVRLTKEQKAKTTEQLKAGKTVVYGLNPA